MNIRQALLGMLVGKRAANFVLKGAGDGLLERIDRLDSLLLGGKTNSGATVNEDTAMRYAAVYTAVRILSEVIGMMPCHLMVNENDTARKAVENPLYRVLYRSPNEWQTAFEFWRHVMVCLLLRGNFYGYVNRNSNKQVQEIIPIHPDRVKVEMTDNYELKYSIIRKNGSNLVLERGEMFHVRAVGSDGVIGMSPIQQARESIGLAMQIEKGAAKLYTNGARLGIVLTHPEVVDEEVAQRIKKSFDEAYSGVENSHKTVLLEEGIKVEKIGMTAEDAQFLDMRKFQRSEILSIFGIPPHMAGDTEKTTSWGTGIEQQTIGFTTFVLMPWVTNIEQAIYRDLLTDRERKNHYAKFNADAIIRGDIKSRYEAYKIGIETGFLLPNEARAKEDLNQIPGLDEVLKPKDDKKPDDQQEKPK